MKRVNILLLLISLSVVAYSQYSDIRPIQTSVQFLELTSNARIGAFAEIGVVSSSFYKDAGLFYNPALLSKKGEYMGGNLSYMPWLRNLVNDISLSEMNAYYSFDSKNKFGYNFRYFSLGDIHITDSNGNISNTVNFYEYFHQITYSRSIKKCLSIGIGVKYIKSDISFFELSNGYSNKPVNTIAIDIGAEYEKQFVISKNSILNFNLGGSINNFGPRIKYTKDPDGDKKFIPTMLRIGFLINPDFYLSDNLRLNIDIAYQADKYLVPSTPIYDYDVDSTLIIIGRNPDISPFKALYQSFYDAPDGIKEELREIMHKFGTEIRMNYKNTFYGAIRLGKNFQHETKENRNSNTMGIGLGLYGFTIDFKYLNSKNKNIDNTWAISLGFRTKIDEKFRF